jgi:protein-L-isoaspartate O-methyltransferase
MPREAQSKRSTIDQVMADASREAYYTQQVLDAQYQDQQHHHHHDHAVVNA